MDFEKTFKGTVSERDMTQEAKPHEAQTPYLNFPDDEKREIIHNITKFISSQGHKIEGKQIYFPIGPEGIEEWIHCYPQQFKTKRLEEIALNNSEFALSMIREITKRKDYVVLGKILRHYQEKPIFEFGVREIESSLKDDKMHNHILMALSEAMEANEKGHKPSKIADHEVAMKTEKKTARPLSEYQRLLKISDEELKTLSGKELLLIGGGFSPIKKELHEKGIHCTVTNIDPISKSNPAIADTVIKKDFYEIDIGEQKFHEIMALHSLPTYAFTPQQVEDFYTRSILSLKKDGILRITPTEKCSDAFTPAMRLSRKPVNNASSEFISKLRKRPDLFSLTEFSIDHEGVFGKTTKMPGITIKVIGTREEVENFIKA